MSNGSQALNPHDTCKTTEVLIMYNNRSLCLWWRKTAPRKKIRSTTVAVVLPAMMAVRFAVVMFARSSLQFTSLNGLTLAPVFGSCTLRSSTCFLSSHMASLNPSSSGSTCSSLSSHSSAQHSPPSKAHRLRQMSLLQLLNPCSSCSLSPPWNPNRDADPMLVCTVVGVYCHCHSTP